MTPKLFSELGLSAEILKAIDKLGFEQAAPIQASAIPILMAGGDVVGQSQTGSGKTAAFAIPAIEKVDPKQRAVQVLILCPTRELAIQVSEEVHKLALYKNGLHALPIYGGQSFERQLMGLRQGANIVIGTPGRVMDHMRRGTLKLGAVKMAVLDEVDVMLNMGFREDIETILQDAPAERQTVFFSATIPRPIQQLIEKYSRNPQQVRIEQKALTVPTVDQVYYEVPRERKIELLTRLIDIHDLKLGIIFCNTKRMVDELVEHLNAQGYSADRLHGDMNQVQRDRVMNKFRKSGLEFLVATDVAARGIDVDDVQVVFNYDLPYDVEDYLHRIGRTGRAGRSGRAISFVAGREVFQIQNIERFTKVRIQRGKPPTAGQVEEARAVVFLDKLRSLLTSGDFKRQDHIIERLLEEGFSSLDISSALLHQLQFGDAPPAPQKVQVQRPPERPVERPVEQPRRDERPVRAESRKEDAPKSPPSAKKDKKKSRRTSVEQTRLWMNVGEAMGIMPIDVVNAVAGETGLPGKVVGTIDIRERHLFADVSAEHAATIVAKLNRSDLKGHKLKVKLA
jgi:ATP-dependent RNA helicase DeaD